MRKPLAVGAATLVVTLSLGLAACGSSDDSDDTLSNADLISQADAICSKYDEKLVTLTNDSGLDNSSSKQEVTAFVSDSIIPLYEDQIDELTALKPNEDDADTYNDIIDTLTSEVQTVKDDPAAAIEVDNPFQGASDKATAFGMKECGNT